MIGRAAALLLAAGPALADAPLVEDVRVEPSGAVLTVHVTLSHPDTGWDHYADGWEVLAPDGARLGFRELLHPHVTEQPFTRSLSGVALPAGVSEVLIRPRCSVDGWNAAAVPVRLDR